MEDVNVTTKKMTRREALKNIGLLASGAFLLSTAAVSCNKNDGKKLLVFYFTSTGNCLYVAKHLSEQPISIPQVLNGDQREFEAEEIGIICPDYRSMAPPIVQEFVQKVKLKADYIFAVITYGMDRCLITEMWDDYARDHGINFNYVNSILMVDNYLDVFDMEQQMQMDKNEEGQIAQVVADINERKEWKQPITPEEHERGEMLLGFVPELFPVRAQDLFQLDKDKCVGCGICTEVCPRKIIKFTSNGIQLEGNCEHCLACAQACPQNAITLRRERNSRARYRHPKINLVEIIRSNRQKNKITTL